MDRDFSNTLISAHSNFGYNYINLGMTTWRTLGSGPRVAGGTLTRGTTGSLPVLLGINQNSFPAVVSKTATGIMFPYTRTDGFDVGVGSGITISGARAQDNATGKWTTPDAYAGDVHDPMSQKSFMWNNNNPYTYSDPSGFDPLDKIIDYEAWFKNVSRPPNEFGRNQGGMHPRNLEAVIKEQNGEMPGSGHEQKTHEVLRGANTRAAAAHAAGRSDVASKYEGAFNWIVSTLKQLGGDVSRTLTAPPGPPMKPTVLPEQLPEVGPVRLPIFEIP